MFDLLPLIATYDLNEIETIEIKQSDLRSIFAYSGMSIAKKSETKFPDAEIVCFACELKWRCLQ